MWGTDWHTLGDVVSESGLQIRERWQRKKTLKDDAQIFKSPNFHRGMIAYAGGGPNTRGIDLFITYMTGNANGTPRVRHLDIVSDHLSPPSPA